MGVLSTKLLTLEEELVVIPNNTLVASTLVNSARGGGDGQAAAARAHDEQGLGPLRAPRGRVGIRAL